MKKLILCLTIFIPMLVFGQDPGVLNLTFNPNPPTEGGTGSANFLLASFAGDIPANSGLKVRIAFGNLLVVGMTPTTTPANSFTWVYDSFGDEWVGTQISPIIDGDAVAIVAPYAVSGLQGSTAIVNVNLVGVPSEAEGNEPLNDNINLSVTIDAALPVKISRFGIDKIGCSQSQLVWTTASETNNEGFVVERSFGDLDNFTQVGFVEGAENSTVEVSYEFIDTYPIDETEAFVYYRLKQVDYDGESDFSDVIKGKRDCSFHVDGFTVTPNPASNETYIKSDVDNEEPKMATLVNSNGQVIEKIAITNPSQRLNLDSYLPGVYSIRMEMDGEVVTKRFIKVQ